MPAQRVRRIIRARLRYQEGLHTLTVGDDGRIAKVEPAAGSAEAAPATGADAIDAAGGRRGHVVRADAQS